MNANQISTISDNRNKYKSKDSIKFENNFFKKIFMNKLTKLGGGGIVPTFSLKLYEYFKRITY